jgi:hypothetical protein
MHRPKSKFPRRTVGGIVRRLQWLVLSVVLGSGVAASTEQSQTAVMQKPARKETTDDQAKGSPYPYAHFLNGRFAVPLARV